MSSFGDSNSSNGEGCGAHSGVGIVGGLSRRTKRLSERSPAPDMGKSKKETEREIELIREAAKQDTAGGGCWKVVACIVCGIIIYSGAHVAMIVAQAPDEDQQLIDERF